MNRIILYLLCVTTFAYGQKGTYTSLEEAIKEPLKVKELILNGKDVSELPDEVKSMKNLRKLSLPHNKGLNITDAIGKLAELKSLRELDISACDLSSLPKDIGSLTQLRILKIGANKLSTLPAEIGNLTGLKELVFSQYPDDFRGFSLDEKRRIIKLVPDCKVLLVDYFGPVHGKYRLGQKEVRVTAANVDAI